VRQAVRKIHRENPAARLVVTGCYAERDAKTLASLPGVDLVVGTAGKDLLPELIGTNPAHAGAGRILQGPLQSGGVFELLPPSKLGDKTRPFVKLQDGCDSRCSYCIVPRVRGPGRSARPEQVISEIRSLVDQGYQEIVLTGVHLGTYGAKLDDQTTLAELLRQILTLPRLGRLRLSSVEPMRFSRKIIDLASESPVFAPHFHIPLQSGSDRILRRMRRPYTAARFLDLVLHIAQRIPAAGLGTDVLVGFPGESEDDFQKTCDLIRRSPVSYVHVFPFSARNGTDACGMTGAVPPEVIRDRAQAVRAISDEKNLEFRRRFVGSKLDAITLAREEALGESVALTGNYIHCRTSPGGPPPNRLIRVRIDRVGPRATFASVTD
jgi:threonylcarbamoyladenosine tRNA methylthiotransferase MtaB